MRNFFLSLGIIFAFVACNDGDVIITTFDFEAIELNVCGDVGDYVFFKINNTNLESLSFQLRTQDSILSVQDTIIYNIDGTTNVVNYRTFNDNIPNSYFCSSIPPLVPQTKQNFESTQGTATVATKIDTTLTMNAGIQDTTIVRKLSIRFTNLRLESSNETITQETLDFGILENNL